MNNEKQTVGAVIAAAGSSRRMNGADKVFAELAGKPVLAYILDVFQNCEVIDRIVLVLSERNIEQGKQLAKACSKVIDICPGGERRQDSVIAGLSGLEGCEWVVISDGARPLVTAELIEQGLEAARETGAAIAAVPVTDTIKLADESMLVQGTPLRSNLWAVQTPQIFRFDIIRKAYRNCKYEVTDDAGAVEAVGGKVKLYNGSYDNIKITTPDDIALAEILLRKRK